MVCITKTLFRTALIGGLALGGLTLIAGPHRMATGFSQVQHTVVSFFDDNIDNPILLRHQLKRLKEEYPARIKKINRSLAEVDGEITNIAYYNDVATNAVSIAKADLASLRGLVNTAEAQLAVYTGTNQQVQIAFQGNRLSVDQAYGKAQGIKQSAMANQDKVTHYQRELEVLGNYRGRLLEQREKLDAEWSTFQTQIWQIERQIAQIERNEDLIDLMEECGENSDSFGQSDVKNLDQLSNKLEAIQKEHVAVLDALSNRVTADSYEKRAKDAMQGRSSSFHQNGDFSWELTMPTVEIAEFPVTPIVVDETMVEDEAAGEIMARLNDTDDN